MLTISEKHAEVPLVYYLSHADYLIPTCALTRGNVYKINNVVTAWQAYV